MGMLENKKGIVMGVANSRSIATGIAEALHKEGAELGFSYLPDEEGKMLRRVNNAISALAPEFVLPCEVTQDDSIAAFFTEVREKYWHEVDFLVHAIAFAPLEDIRCPTMHASRAGFLTAMNVSVYSLIAVTAAAQPLLTDNGAITTMTYYGGEKVIPGYNLMGVCKAALDCTVRYLAYDVGRPRGIRVNNVSSGPLKTLASSAIADFSQMQKRNAELTPLPHGLEKKDVGNLTAFLVSDYATAITGELIHVDNGFHLLGATPPSSG